MQHVSCVQLGGQSRIFGWGSLHDQLLSVHTSRGLITCKMFNPWQQEEQGLSHHQHHHQSTPVCWEMLKSNLHFSRLKNGPRVKMLHVLFHGILFLRGVRKRLPLSFPWLFWYVRHIRGWVLGWQREIESSVRDSPQTLPTARGVWCFLWRGAEAAYQSPGAEHSKPQESARRHCLAKLLNQ